MKTFLIFAAPLVLLSACSSTPSHQQLLNEYLELSATSHDVPDLELHFMSVLSGKALTAAVITAEYLQRADISQAGVALAEISSQDESSVEFCLDVSGTSLVNAAGVDVTPSDRPPKLPMHAELNNSWGLVSIQKLTVREVSTC